jgi:hypothetical protein
LSGPGHERQRFDGFVDGLSGSSGGFCPAWAEGFWLFGKVSAEAATFLRTGLLGLYLREADDHLCESVKKLSRSRLTGARTGTKSVSSAAGFLWILVPAGLQGLDGPQGRSGRLRFFFVSQEAVSGTRHLFFDK